jgi:eukaryotic-like serine/threonine-protein kinase
MPRDRTRGRIFVGALNMAARSTDPCETAGGGVRLSISRVGSSGSSSTEVSLPATPVGGGSDALLGRFGGAGGGGGGANIGTLKLAQGYPSTKRGKSKPGVIWSPPGLPKEWTVEMREVIVGDHLDQYDLTELLARSGMASIFKAIDRESGQTVALKVPYMQFEADVVFHERFEREERIGQRLEHPSIIKVLTPKEKSRMYIAMEFAEGRSLRAIMNDKRPMPTDQALDIARHLTEALVYLHGQGIVHRDLKPENILILPDGHIKLLDFGIALDESSRRLTWFGLSNTVGTPDYMAPEQVGGRRGDIRTDVYAVGTMLYEMLTGELPYSGSNAHSLMRAKQNDDPRPPRQIVSSIAPEIEEIIMHAIERSPRYRYESAKQMLDELRDPSTVKPRSEEQRTRGPVIFIPRKKIMLGALVAVVALLILLTWMSSKKSKTPHPPRPSYRSEVR